MAQRATQDDQMGEKCRRCKKGSVQVVLAITSPFLNAMLRHSIPCQYMVRGPLGSLFLLVLGPIRFEPD